MNYANISAIFLSTTSVKVVKLFQVSESTFSVRVGKFSPEIFKYSSIQVGQEGFSFSLSKGI